MVSLALHFVNFPRAGRSPAGYPLHDRRLAGDTAACAIAILILRSSGVFPLAVFVPAFRCGATASALALSPHLYSRREAPGRSRMSPCLAAALTASPGFLFFRAGHP